MEIWWKFHKTYTCGNFLKCHACFQKLENPYDMLRHAQHEKHFPFSGVRFTLWFASWGLRMKNRPASNCKCQVVEYYRTNEQMIFSSKILFSSICFLQFLRVMSNTESTLRNTGPLHRTRLVVARGVILNGDVYWTVANTERWRRFYRAV